MRTMVTRVSVVAALMAVFGRFRNVGVRFRTSGADRPAVGNGRSADQTAER
jgi:hypothetical protein